MMAREAKPTYFPVWQFTPQPLKIFKIEMLAALQGYSYRRLVEDTQNISKKGLESDGCGRVNL